MPRDPGRPTAPRYSHDFVVAVSRGSRSPGDRHRDRAARSADAHGVPRLDRSQREPTSRTRSSSSSTTRRRRVVGGDRAQRQRSPGLHASGPTSDSAARSTSPPSRRAAGTSCCSTTTAVVHARMARVAHRDRATPSALRHRGEHQSQSRRNAARGRCGDVVRRHDGVRSATGRPPAPMRLRTPGRLRLRRFAPHQQGRVGRARRLRRGLLPGLLRGCRLLPAGRRGRLGSLVSAALGGAPRSLGEHRGVVFRQVSLRPCARDVREPMVEACSKTASRRATASVARLEGDGQPDPGPRDRRSTSRSRVADRDSAGCTTRSRRSSGSPTSTSPSSRGRSTASRAARFFLRGVRVIADLEQHLATDGVDFDVVIVSRPHNGESCSVTCWPIPPRRARHLRRGVSVLPPALVAGRRRDGPRPPRRAPARGRRDEGAGARARAVGRLRRLHLGDRGRRAPRGHDRTGARRRAVVRGAPTRRAAGFEQPRATSGCVAGWAAGPGSPNADGLQWFAKMVMPKCARRFPAVDCSSPGPTHRPT